MDSGTATPQGGGLPHSEIHGSKGARPSPRLFAACHVLHRLSVPRHPPNALRRLISAADKTAHASRIRHPGIAAVNPQQSLPEPSISRHCRHPAIGNPPKTARTPQRNAPANKLRSPSSSQCPIPMRQEARRPPIAISSVLLGSLSLSRRSTPPRQRLGGGGRNRTDDLKLAKLALSQLSYAPTSLLGSPGAYSAWAHQALRDGHP